MKESQVQKLIHTSYASRKDVMALVPNIYFFDDRTECDCLAILDSGNTIEFEIKASRWDYLQDFKKRDKHSRMESLTDLTKIPNQFYYVCPEGLIQDEEIHMMGYSGLIYIIDKGMGKRYLKEVRKAPYLHTEKLEPHKYMELAFKLAGRIW